MAEETVFYRDDDLLVTSTRIVIGTEVYALRGITSVSAGRVRQDVTIPAAVVIAGALTALFTYGETVGLIIGVVLFVAGVMLAVRKNSERTYAALLRMANGDILSYESNDSDDITKVVDAVNQAIISQG